MQGSTPFGAWICVLTLLTLVGACGGPVAARSLTLRPASHNSTAAVLQGPVSAPGGPFLRDAFGRVVFMHGVNAVYKRPPFVLYPAPGRPWDFSARDASRIASLGFDVVRLGILWKGLEPGIAGPNDSAICTPGTPHDPHQFDPGVLDSYLAKVAQTVGLLARYHVYTLLDMHQDVYNELFRGEGAPAWAVCTDGLPIKPLPGRWSNNYANPAADAAYDHFWKNDVVGDLQGEYDRVWGAVAAYFANDPWVIGYDPFNEPFSRSILSVDGREFDAQIECFYTGRTRPGSAVSELFALSCPVSDPATGLIPTIEGSDPRHLIFYEPDIFTAEGRPNYVGPIPFPGLVLNFHAYCSERSPVTGDPFDTQLCARQVLDTLISRHRERINLDTTQQPGGPGWFMSEFGATNNVVLLERLTGYANQLLVGWCYWAWKYYDDPTGSSDEALTQSDGSLRPAVAALSVPYPQAVAGTPTEVSFNPTTAAFTLEYFPDHQASAPTIVFVPTALHYPQGYCARALGARVLAGPSRTVLLLQNHKSASKVRLIVAPGQCGAAE